jgi:hypothetical protein
MEAIVGSIIIFGGISSCCLYRCFCKTYEPLPTNGIVVTNALRMEWGQPTIPSEKKSNET